MLNWDTDIMSENIVSLIPLKDFQRNENKKPSKVNV